MGVEVTTVCSSSSLTTVWCSASYAQYCRTAWTGDRGGLLWKAPMPWPVLRSRCWW